MNSTCGPATRQAHRYSPAGAGARSGWLLLVAVLMLLAIYLRFANLADNPGWDGDEGYNWNIASNLAAGHLQMFGLRYAFVQHPPLFYLLSAALMRVWTHDLIALRAVAATSGVLSVVAVYALCSRLGGRGLGVTAATVMTIWPLVVVQQRWAYTYNLLALLIPVSLWLVLRDAASSGDEEATAPTSTTRVMARRSRCAGAMAAGLLAGLALATDQEAIALVPALAILVWPRGAVCVLVAGISTAIAPLAYVTWMLVARNNEFVFDVKHSATRLDLGPATLVGRFIDLLKFEPLIAVGLIGVLFTARGSTRRALVVLTAGLLLIVLAVRDPAPYFRAAVPLLPLVAIGIGTVLCGCWRLLSFLLVFAGSPSARHQAKKRARLAYAIFITPFILSMLASDVTGAGGRFKTAIDAALPRSPAAAHAMADWVNARVAPSSLVIIMPEESWLIACRTTDLLQAVAISGHGTSFYPSALPRSHFAFDTSLSAATYLVIDDFTRRWIAENVRERALATFARTHWQTVYHEGEYTIYANPLRVGRSGANNHR